MHHSFVELEPFLDVLYERISAYKSLLNKFNAVIPSEFYEFIDDEVQLIDSPELEEWLKENREASHEISESRHSYIFACGSLLQTAYYFIKQFAPVAEIPGYIEYSPKNPETLNNFKKFCSGRMVKEIHLGLIVFLGRNQFNHFDEAELRRPNKDILQKLSLDEIDGKKCQDPAFQQANPKVPILAGNIVSILEWSSKEKFLADVSSILDGKF